MKSNKTLEYYLEDLKKFPLLSKEEEKHLLEEMQKGNKKARQKIIESNLRLVISIAKKYQYEGLELLDLIEEGNIALIEALDKFDIDKGVCFSTYATLIINQRILRAIDEKGKVIKSSNYIRILQRKVYTVRNNFLNEFNREPTKEEIAEKLGISKMLVERVLKEMQTIISLDKMYTDNFTLGKNYCDRTEESVEEKVIDKIDVEEILSILETYPSKWQYVIKKSLGLEDSECLKRKEIADNLQITKQRVGVIERKTLEKIRKKLKEK